MQGVRPELQLPDQRSWLQYPRKQEGTPSCVPAICVKKLVVGLGLFSCQAVVSNLHGTITIMIWALNVLKFMSKCVACGGCPTRCHRAGASSPCNSCLGESMIL